MPTNPIGFAAAMSLSHCFVRSDLRPTGAVAQGQGEHACIEAPAWVGRRPAHLPWRRARRMTLDLVPRRKPVAAARGFPGILFHMSDPVETIKVARAEAGLRLDRWFRVHFPDVGLRLSAEAAAVGSGARQQQARRRPTSGSRPVRRSACRRWCGEPAKAGAVAQAAAGRVEGRSRLPSSG